MFRISTLARRTAAQSPSEAASATRPIERERKMTKSSENGSILNVAKDESAVKAIWRSADAACFDVDSTVCQDEAIDELAKFVGKQKEVAEITKNAMSGGCSFRDALSKRLEMIQPNLTVLREFLKKRPLHLTPGVKDLVEELHSRDVPVYLISGGFHCVIGPVAEELGIPEKNVFANRLQFYFNGEFAGFDLNEPTSQQDGKSEIIGYLKHRYGYRRLVMIGDGAIDMATSPPADAFVGFGGNQVRETVKNEAKWFAMSFKELLDELRKD